MLIPWQQSSLHKYRLQATHPQECSSSSNHSLTLTVFNNHLNPDHIFIKTNQNPNNAFVISVKLLLHKNSFFKLHLHGNTGYIASFVLNPMWVWVCARVCALARVCKSTYIYSNDLKIGNSKKLCGLWNDSVWNFMHSQVPGSCVCACMCACVHACECVRGRCL